MMHKCSFLHTQTNVFQDNLAAFNKETTFKTRDKDTFAHMAFTVKFEIDVNGRVLVVHTREDGYLVPCIPEC
jgi:hypothetical protein